MKAKSVWQQKTISASTPEEYDRLFNEFCKDLTDAEVHDWSAFCSTIRYREKQLVPENLADELELRGEVYYCKDCPYFIKGEDGNHRCKGCSKHIPNAVDYTPACELFLNDYVHGKVKPRG